MVAALTAVEVFCAYANADDAWRQKLETHLSLLIQQGLISLWHHRLISPGTNRAESIDTHLETASVILLLVSADFLKHCYGPEMKRALARQEAGEALVIPILVHPANWKHAPFAHLQVLPLNAKPIALWANKDTVLADVANSIRRVIVEELPHLTASAPRVALPDIWNIPYPRNSFFLGRENELAQIRRHLQAGQTTALSISGLGGIGKTQLALEYAYRYCQGYQTVLWAHAESAEALASSYVAIASLLRLPERETKEQDAIVQAVKTWFQKHRGWLLILDNADELALIPDFLAPSLGGHLLLTTRAATTGRLAHRLEIATLLPEDGALFLLRRAALIAPDSRLEQASPEEQKLALQIAQELGGLPLALDQAGAYLEETKTDLADYWQIYQQHRAELLQKRGGLVADHPDPVATTWSLSFQRITDKNPAAAELLRMLAFLAPDAIAEEILREGTSSLGSVLAPVTADAFLLNQAIEILRLYSLVQRDPKRRILSIHRLVQVVLLDSMSEQERVQQIKRIITAMHQLFPDVTDEALQENATFQGERLLPHVLASIRHVSSWTIVPQDLTFPLANLLYVFACYLSKHPRPTEAASLYEQILRIQKPDDLRSISFIQNWLAILYQKEGKYREAELYLLSCLHLAKRISAEPSDWKAALLHNLAVCCEEQGRHEEAAQHFRSSDKQRQGAPLTLSNANSMYNQAIVRKNQGRHEEAEQLYLQALRLREQVLGSNHPDVAVSLNGLAVLYLTQGRLSDAEPLYQRALSIKERTFGPAHPAIVSPMNNLANLYVVQRRYAEAEALCRRGLLIWEQALVPNHPDIALVLRTWAWACLEQGKYEEAQQLCQRALSIYEQTDHQDASTARLLLATIKEKNER